MENYYHNNLRLSTEEEMLLFASIAALATSIGFRSFFNTSEKDGTDTMSLLDNQITND